MSLSQTVVFPLSGCPQTTRSGITNKRISLSQPYHKWSISAQASNTGEDSLHLGVDFGTSGARVSVIDSNATQVYESKTTYSQNEGEYWDRAWQRALIDILSGVPEHISDRIVSLAFDGTSSTTLLVDVETSKCLEEPKWYNEAQGTEAQSIASSIAPEGHTARAATSTLCKVLEWDLAGKWQEHQANGKNVRIMHQADWLAFLLHGVPDQSDYTNALKLGYDPEIDDYPDWLKTQEFFPLLPQSVLSPGTPVGEILGDRGASYGLNNGCLICSGTTDSIAAFLAAGASEMGEAVTSLGSTLAIKMLSNHRVDDVKYGVYSHRLGDLWLVGGASNTGGAVLKKYFVNEELKELSERIDSTKDSGLDYYPLLSPGERFPINDPNFTPRLEPRPEDDVQFLHGILQGIASIELQSYQLLEKLGAGKLQRVYTSGGGAINETWTQIRSRKLGVPVIPAPQGEAAYGAALLARTGYESKVNEKAIEGGH